VDESNVRCKGVHVKLDRLTHARFKMKLIEHGLTMQEAFESFARFIGDGNSSANNLLEKHIRTKLKEELAEVGITPLRKRKTPRYVSELSDAAIYDLIDRGDDDETTDTGNE